MTYKAIYTEKAIKDLNALPKQVNQRIVKKIKFFRTQENPLSFAKPLQNSPLGSYRFRIGDYRAIFDVDSSGNLKILLILSIKHRREVYRDK